MDINTLISKNQICIDLKGKNKKEVIAEMVDILNTSGKLNDKNLYLQDVIKREEAISTGIGNGIAIPHGKSTAVNEASLALGISRQGIDFDSLDEEPVHIIFLIAAPENADDLHLKILSQLSRKLMHEEFRNALKSAKSNEEIINILNN